MSGDVSYSARRICIKQF